MAQIAPSSSPIRNKILAALNKADYQNLFSQLELVSVSQGEVVYEADNPINYVYFPENAVFSMLSTMEDGRTVEVGPVGHEGLVGLRIFLGAATSADQVIMHVAGDAMRFRASVLKASVRHALNIQPSRKPIGLREEPVYSIEHFHCPYRPLPLAPETSAARGQQKFQPFACRSSTAQLMLQLSQALEYGTS